MYALQQMNRLQRMMDECLDETVEEALGKLFGKPFGWTNRHVQLRDHNRYFIISQQNNWQIWVGCGLTFNETLEYPSLGIIFSVKPNNPERDKVIQVMREFVANNTEWNAYDLDDDKGWSYIAHEKELLSILGAEDHIAIIQQHFVGKLHELHAIKVNNPNLGWRSDDSKG